MLFPDTPVSRFVLRVRVDIDQTGHHKTATPIDLMVPLPIVVGAYIHDPVIRKNNVRVTGVAVSFQRCIPDSTPVGFSNQCGSHKLSVRCEA